MTGGRIGRLLVASLHQAIADVLPTRLEFYEYWLSADGLRSGRIGLAPLTAVVSFLRQEAAYSRVVDRAGRYAAEWTAAAWPPPIRVGLNALPGWLRVRLAVRLARRLIRHTSATVRSVVVGGGTAVVEFEGSLFCAVRHARPDPLCGFYAAAVRRLFELLDLPAAVEVAACRACGATACRLVVAPRGRTGGEPRGGADHSPPGVREASLKEAPPPPR